jgi:glyoxylase-like metal-dependent hydrolase (beta-lactamase superfamily II)
MQQPSIKEIFGSYMAWKLDEATWCINFMNGSQNIYLLEGEEKALLLDTGWGTGNLRAFVEKLTDKEILVANTHFHPDHSAGNGEFEKVFVSKGAEIDAPSLNSLGPFDLSKLPYPDYEKVYIGEGDKIELGGRTIEVLEALPAHCNSSLFFLDRGHKMFFTGDEMEAGQVNLFDNSNNPEAPYDVKERLDNFYKNNKRMQELSGEYDYLLPNHNGAVISKGYVQEFIEMVEHIYSGDATVEDKLNHKFIEMDPKAKELCRVRYKNSSIFIKKALLMEVYGNQL